MGEIKATEFKELRLRPQVEKGNEVSIHYGLAGVPKKGMYVARFWPHGRHKGTYEDFPIGMLDKGEDKAGQFRAWAVPGISKKTTIHYNLDLDVWKDEEAYRQGLSDEHLGQCDRGGDLTLDGGGGGGGGGDTDPKPKWECHKVLDEKRNVVTAKSVKEGDPEFGTHPRRTIVTPGKCK